MLDNKKRHIVSYEKMSAELAAAFNEKYPAGFDDYLQDLVKYPHPNPDREPFYAVTIELPDSINLVKINVKIDDEEDVKHWLESEEDAEEAQVAGTTVSSDGEGGTLPDDNISQYGADEDPQENI